MADKQEESIALIERTNNNNANNEGLTEKSSMMQMNEDFSVDVNVEESSPSKRIVTCCDFSQDEVFQVFAFFGIHLFNSSSTVRFSVLCLSMFTIYSLYGILQEYIFNSIPGFKFGGFVTAMHFLLYVVVSGFQCIRQPGFVLFKVQAPAYHYCLVGFLSVTTIGLSTYSCQYLNYPTQLMFKSCKLIPVMLIGVIYFGKIYTLMDYIAVLSLTIGMILFSLGDSFVKASFPLVGVFLVSGALMADALIGNFQEKSMKQFNPSTSEMMFYSKSFGLIVIILALLPTGELVDAFYFCLLNHSAAGYVFALAFTGCIGEFFVFSMLKQFGPLLTVTTTSIRKMFSIAASFLFFPKPFALVYLIGGLQVALGIFLEIYVKNKNDIDNLLRDLKQKFWRS